MTVSNKDSATVDEMRDAIAAITGFLPQSRNPDYLEKRLKDLRSTQIDSHPKQARRGPASARPDKAQPFTISMISARVDLLDTLCRDAKTTRSEIIRRALDLFAGQHGKADDVAAIQRVEAKINGGQK